MVLLKTILNVNGAKLNPRLLRRFFLGEGGSGKLSSDGGNSLFIYNISMLYLFLCYNNVETSSYKYHR